MRRVPLLSFVVCGLVLASCASAPRSKVPEWVLATPRSDAAYSYFVGQASAPEGRLSDAMGDAAANLVASIVQYIGVAVRVDTSATAKATLDSYSAEIRQSVTTEAASRLSGFLIKERYVFTDKASGRVTVYVLAAYATADLEREKARIAALFKEKEDAVAAPEAAAAALAKAGRAYEAVGKYIEAALAASASGVENAGLKAERNINSARDLAARLRLSSVAAPSRAFVAEPFATPFTFRVSLEGGNGSGGVAGAKVLVRYLRRQGTRTASKTESATTNTDGLLSFSPPPPDFVGKGRLTVGLDFRSAMDLLAALPGVYSQAAGALEDELRASSIEVSYDIDSKAKDLPTALAIVDIDDGGALSGTQTQDALAEALTRERFALRPSGIDAASLATMGDAAVLAAARVAAPAALGGAYARLVYGRALIIRVRKDGSTFIAEAKADIKAIDLSSGALLYSAERAASGLGPDEAAARKAAYRDLGLNAVAKDLLASLP